MFRVLKWAYDMGVRQERLRIRNAMTDELLRGGDENRQFDFGLRDEKTPKEKRIEFEKQLAVNHRVAQVLTKILTPRGTWVEIGNAPIDGEK